MQDYYSRHERRGLALPQATTPDLGPSTDPNPGEAALGIEGATPMKPESQPGRIGTGAQVGIMRNLEFSAGGRAHRISTGPYITA